MRYFKLLITVCLSSIVSINVYPADLSAFEQWQAQKQLAFTQFKDERDQAFIEQIQTRWIEYKAQPGKLRDSTPKPTQIPKITDDRTPKFDGNLVQLQKPEVELATPKHPVQSKPVQPGIKGKPISFDFFGDVIDLVLPQNFHVNLKYPLDDQSISQAWAQLASSDYEIVQDQLQAEMNAYQLKDWAKMQLILKFSSAVPNSRPNERIVLSWFLLNRFGLDIRVAYSNASLFLLLPIKQEVYEVAFLTEQGRKYYIFNMDGGVQRAGRLYSYRGDFDPRSKNVDVQFEALIWKKPQLKSKTLNFNWDNKDINLSTEYAGQDVKFYGTYPLIGLDSYFDSSYRFDYGNGLLIQLHELINGRSEAEALNMVLRFVQTSFEYETDDEQFGGENYLLPTEMLHYRASDCEDRSILFAWLVEQLFDYDVIGLKYPGHVTTGIAIKGDLRGDSVELKSINYLIADPTYINANVGMAMKSYRDLRPELL